MALTIPARHRPVFEQLLALSREERDKLLEALQRLETSSLDVGQLSKQIVPVSPLTKEATEDAISVLISVHALPHVMAITQEELAPAIMEALSKDRSLSATPDQLEEFRPFIEDVLGLESTLGLIAKGHQLITANERLFCGVTVFTDLRPIFLGEEVGEPAAFIGNHTLRISFHRPDFDLDEVFISMGPKELRKLGEAVERAQRKEKSLRAFADKSGIPFLSREDEPC